MRPGRLGRCRPEQMFWKAVQIPTQKFIQDEGNAEMPVHNIDIKNASCIQRTAGTVRVMKKCSALIFLCATVCCSSWFRCSPLSAAEPGEIPLDPQTPVNPRALQFQKPPPLTDNEYESLARFLQAVQTVHSTYVDPEKVTYDKLFDAALKGMLSQLDPFSRYESPEDLQAVVNSNKGEYAGIGITILERDGLQEIVAVLPGSPAAEAGLKAGDRITAVDGKVLPTSGSVYYPGNIRIQGLNGTPVKLTVFRESENKVLDFEVIRGTVKYPSVANTAPCPDNPSIGYVQILHFSDDTAKELDQAVDKLLSEGIQALIIDLRENPGGKLETAVEICSRFLPEGDLIVSLEDRENKTLYKSLPTRKYPDIPLVILINESSASCSEIMAGCLQDYRKAFILGETSFGKGSVQMLFPNRENGSALRITVAKYYTPEHRSIHGKGVRPDIEVPLPDQNRQAILNRIMIAGPNAQASLPESMRDVQYQKAVDLLSGILLYLDRNNTESQQPAQAAKAPETEKTVKLAEPQTSNGSPEVLLPKTNAPSDLGSNDSHLLQNSPSSGSSVQETPPKSLEGSGSPAAASSEGRGSQTE